MIDLFTSEEERREALVGELVKIPSPTGGERAVADWLQRLWTAEGWDVNREGDNLWVMSAGFDAGRETLLLLAPLDCPAYEEGRKWREALVGQWERFVGFQDPERNVLFVACAHTRDLGERGLPLLLPLLPRVDEAVLALPADGHTYGGERGLVIGRLRTNTIEELMTLLASLKGRNYEILRMEGEKGRGAWAIVRGEEAMEGAETLRVMLGRRYESLEHKGESLELRDTTVLGFLPQDVKCRLV